MNERNGGFFVIEMPTKNQISRRQKWEMEFEKRQSLNFPLKRSKRGKTPRNAGKRRFHFFQNMNSWRNFFQKLRIFSIQLVSSFWKIEIIGFRYG